MNIPPLSSSFLSTGFINPEMIQGKEEKVMADVAKTFGSLSIDMVEVEDQEASNTSYLHSHEDKFWTIGPLLNFSLSLNFQTSNDHEQSSVSA